VSGSAAIIIHTEPIVFCYRPDARAGLPDNASPLPWNEIVLEFFPATYYYYAL
jgi:hypothetical protein